MNLIDKINIYYSKSPDLITKSIEVNKEIVYIIYLETISSSDKVNAYILNDLILSNDKHKKLESIIAGPNTIFLRNFKEIISYLNNGYTIIVDKKIYAIETRAELHRAVERASIEASIKGPQDSFTENYQINLGLVKRRIKDHELKTENLTIGERTQTMIGIIYLEDLAKKETITIIKSKIENAKVNAILDSSDIAKIIGDEESRFPTIMETERPDNVANALLDGKVAIIIDTCSNVVIAPSFWVDFINPASDRYTKSLNVNFIKILRLLAFFISLLAPALYIALSNFNQETLPTKILINFAAQREGVPFPAAVEVFIMLIICEILRESDLRFPAIFGSAISVLGALILGEAAVSAGIVSPIIIIVVALSFICSLIFTDINLINALRFYRFLFLFAASILGLYGMVLLFIYFVSKITSIDSVGYSYSNPLAPFNIKYLWKTIIASKIKDV